LLAIDFNWYLLLYENGAAQAKFSKAMTGTWGDGLMPLKDSAGEQITAKYKIDGDLITLTYDYSDEDVRIFKRSSDKPPVFSMD
jgi:hypothetical protein